jgi:hypothetical protein
MRNKVVILMLGILLFSGGLTQAELITIAISGHVTAINDMYSNLNGKINMGDAITGTYIYDSATPDSNPDQNIGEYFNYASPAGISVKIGEFAFQTNPNNVKFLVGTSNDNPSGEDVHWLASYHNLSLSNGALVAYINWQLNDSTRTALSSDVLPLTAPNLSNWNFNNFRIDISRSGTGTIQGIITSAVLVPEPCSILLFLAGGIVFRRQKRSR